MEIKIKIINDDDDDDEFIQIKNDLLTYFKYKKANMTKLIFKSVQFKKICFTFANEYN